MHNIRQSTRELDMGAQDSIRHHDGKTKKTKKKKARRLRQVRIRYGAAGKIFALIDRKFACTNPHSLFLCKYRKFLFYSCM